MATENSLAPASSTRLSYSTSNRLKNSVKYKYRIQSAPPLSIRQFLRSSTGVIAGAKEWKSSGKYHEPTYHAYLSPAVRERPKIVEPQWHAAGRYIDKRPTSLSPETRPQIIVKPEVWKPAGKVQHTPVPYFDPPNLRWSLQELRRSTPDMRSQTLVSSRSTSALRKRSMTEETWARQYLRHFLFLSWC